MDKTGWFQFGWHFMRTVQAQFFGAMISNLTLFFCGRMGCSKVPTPCRVPDGTDAKQKQAQRRMEQSKTRSGKRIVRELENEHHVWFTNVY